MKIRFPGDLKTSIENAAASANRSMNSEIVARLKLSLESARALPDLVLEAVENERAERGGSDAAALTRLVLAGQAHGGTILYLTLDQKTTVKQIQQMLEAGKAVIPPTASVVIERKLGKAGK